MRVLDAAPQLRQVAVNAPRAQELLETTDIPIERACGYVGFGRARKPAKARQGRVSGRSTRPIPPPAPGPGCHCVPGPGGRDPTALQGGTFGPMWPRGLALKVAECSSRKVWPSVLPAAERVRERSLAPAHPRTPLRKRAQACARPRSRGCAKERRFTDMTADRTKEGGAGGTSRVVGRVQDFRGPGR